MTRCQVADKISNRTNHLLNFNLVDQVLIHLEQMNLIKFETEREATIREAEEWLKSGKIYREEDVGKYHDLIKRLVSLIK